jgi:CRP-like cAMP-binding protein
VPGAGEEALTVLKRGACFGEMAVFDRSRRSTDAIAHGRCSLLTIARADFEELLENDRVLAHKVLWSVVRLLCERLRSTNDSLRSIMVMAMF